MRILIIGGTIFLGRHIAEVARERGHEVTLFNRGKSHPELFPELERIAGDRAKDLGLLEGRTWDAVVDTCGYHPREVGASARLLAGACDHYTFISSINVYSGWPEESGVTEDSPLAELQGEMPEQWTPETYGALKVLCERAVEEALPGRALHVRSGLIVGPHDPSDRFTYWPRRIAAGGEVLAPGEPQRTIQLIDVLDTSEWVLDMAEGRRGGAYNVTGPERPLAMGDLLEGCIAATGSDARLTWVPDDFLQEREVAPFRDLPHWMPGVDDDVSVGTAVGAGLRFRPLSETVRRVLAWDASLPADREMKAGISRDREQELLDLWHSAPS
jgi:2'-hydroxyisoflavone reductase